MTPVSRTTRVVRAFVLSAGLAAASLMTGCASMYVDTATKEVPVASMKKPAQLKPTQVSFEFKTRGAPNAAATKQLTDNVIKQVGESGLFAPAGASGAAMLNISIDNIQLGNDPTSKAIVTGLTFGLAGTAVSDGYVCTLTYLAPGQSTPVVKKATHAIHTTIGNAGAPEGAGPKVDALTAINTVTRDVVSNALRDLSLDPSFN